MDVLRCGERNAAELCLPWKARRGGRVRRHRRGGMGRGVRAAATVLRRCRVMGRAGGFMAWGRVQKVKVAAAEPGWERGEEYLGPPA